MSARVWAIEMANFPEGAEVDVDSHEQWSALQPAPGLVVEFSAKTSSLAHVEDDWAAYFISKVENRLDGS